MPEVFLKLKDFTQCPTTFEMALARMRRSSRQPGPPVDHVTREGAQGSFAAVAYRRDPTGEFHKRLLDGTHAPLPSMFL